MPPFIDIGKTAKISVDLYALACFRLMGCNREFTILVPEGVKPSDLTRAFRRLGCKAVIH